MKSLKNHKMQLSMCKLSRFLKKYMGGNNDLDIERLKQEYESLKDENSKLKLQVEDLKQ
jgi:hypothetical protein